MLRDDHEKPHEESKFKLFSFSKLSSKNKKSTATPLIELSTIKPDTWSSLLNSVTSLASSSDNQVSSSMESNSETAIPVSLQPLDHLTLSQLLADFGNSMATMDNTESFLHALSSLQNGNTQSPLDVGNSHKVSLEELVQLLPQIGTINSDHKSTLPTTIINHSEEKSHPSPTLSTRELESLTADLPELRPQRNYGNFFHENNTFSKLADVMPFEMLKAFPFVEIGEEFNPRGIKSFDISKPNSMSTGDDNDSSRNGGEKVHKSIPDLNSQAKYKQGKEEEEDEDDEER